MLGEVEFEVKKVSIAVREGRREKRGVRKDGALRRLEEQCRCGWMDGQKRKASQLRGQKAFRCQERGIALRMGSPDGKLQQLVEGKTVEQGFAAATRVHRTRLSGAYQTRSLRVIVRARREATMAVRHCGEGTRAKAREQDGLFLLWNSCNISNS
jgi:hypothetical protein